MVVSIHKIVIFLSLLLFIPITALAQASQSQQVVHCSHCNQPIAWSEARYSIGIQVKESDLTSNNIIKNPYSYSLPSPKEGERWLQIDGWYYLINHQTKKVINLKSKRRSYEEIQNSNNRKKY